MSSPFFHLRKPSDREPPPAPPIPVRRCHKCKQHRSLIGGHTAKARFTCRDCRTDAPKC